MTLKDKKEESNGIVSAVSTQLRQDYGKKGFEIRSI